MDNNQTLESLTEELATAISLDENIYNNLQDLMSQTLSENSLESWKKLQLKAQSFLTTNNFLDNQITALQKEYSLIKKSGDPATAYASLRLKLVQTVQLRYTAAFMFDQQLTKFYGEVPRKALYVYQNSKGDLSTYELDLVGLIKAADYTGRIREGQIKSESNHIIEKLDKENKEKKMHIAQAQNAYKGIANRLARFYEKANLPTKQSGIVMWKLGRRWTLAQVLNYGDLKEAYAAAIMTKHLSDLDVLCGISSGTPPYYSHELISTFFNQYVYNVTNKAAIIEEDIVTDVAQYAVKGAKSALPSILQYIVAAETIINNPNFMSQEEFKNKLMEYFPKEVHRNKTYTSVKDVSIAELSKTELQSIIKSLKLQFKVI